MSRDVERAAKLIDDAINVSGVGDLLAHDSRVVRTFAKLLAGELRRARGRTVLWAMVDQDALTKDWSPYGWVPLGTNINVRMTKMIGKASGVRREVARVVLVRKPKAGKRGGR